MTDSVAGWSPPGPSSGAPDAWHPDDILLAPLHSPGGELVGILSVDLPVGGRRPGVRQCRLLEQYAAHAALALEQARVHTLVTESEQLFRAVFDRSPIAIALMTVEGVVTRVNAAYERLIGRPAEEVIGTVATELRPAETADQYEVGFARPDGTAVRGRVNRTLLLPEVRGLPPVLLAQVEDITALRAVQQELAHAASHDQLTGLANRSLLLEQLRESLLAGRSVGVLYCDVDRFKQINDELGHAAGDRLLVEIARRLAAAARPGDLVGRFGGDEFVLVADPLPVPAAEELAARVWATVAEPLEVAGRTIRPSLSIGLALAGSETSADALVAAADQALYAAKSAGRGRWVVR